MGRFVLALLVVGMLSLTAFVAYSTLGPSDSPPPAPVITATAPPAETPACCDDATPACCKEKSTCCQTKGDEGACCQNPKKAEKKD